MYYVHVHCLIFVMSRYSLKPPTYLMIESYVEKVFDELFKHQLDKEKVITKFLQIFKNRSKDMCSVTQWKAACRIVAKKLVHKTLH